MPADPFEDRLRQGLRRVADEARLSPDARGRLHRRARREPLRRAGVVALSYAMVVALAVVAFVATRPAGDGDDDVARPGPAPSAPPTTPAPTTPDVTPSTEAPPEDTAPATPTSGPETSGTATTTTTVVPGPAFGLATVRRAHEPAGIPRVTRLEVGRHDDTSFDRVVIGFDGELPGYEVSYVDQLVQDGSGNPVTLAGGAAIQVTLSPADAHDDAGAATLATPRLTPGYPAVKEARLVSDFEATVIVGLGTGARTGFRVLELTGPNRLVIDVLHG